jgi:uncharacterized protein (TIGR03435 family)
MTRLTGTVVLASAVLMAARGNAAAQSVRHVATVTPHPYDVASVKPNVGVDTVARASNAPRMTLINTSVAVMLERIYAVAPDRIVGLPDWAAHDRFDLIVSAPDATFRDDLGLMLAVLTDRFGLRSHVETRQMPIYVLSRVHPDQLGPALVAHETCVPGSIRGANDSWTATCATWPLVANFIGNQFASRPVADGTGLSGRFDVTLTWNRELRDAPAANAVSVAGDLPNLFTALQEQLGLKVEPSRGPVDVLVLDRLERPGPN